MNSFVQTKKLQKFTNKMVYVISKFDSVPTTKLTNNQEFIVIL